jgi:peptidyl-prolyl cis-trans isomerase C
MSSCSVHNIPNGPRTPVKVNGVVISRALISREVQNHPAPTPIAAWKAATLALVVREALAQEVKRLDIQAEPIADGAGRRETPDEANMRALVDREVVTPEPTEDECRRYYERNLARFRSPDIYEAAHILFAARPDVQTGYAASLLQAHSAIAELQANPGAFADLARSCSACPSGQVGGNLGQISTGQTTPEFEAALIAMRPGEISRTPVETRYGVHIIRLDRKVEGRVIPFEIVRERIATYLTEAVRRRAQAQFVARLLATARVEGIEIPTPGELNVH